MVYPHRHPISSIISSTLSGIFRDYKDGDFYFLLIDIIEDSEMMGKTHNR